MHDKLALQWIRNRDSRDNCNDQDSLAFQFFMSTTLLDRQLYVQTRNARKEAQHVPLLRTMWIGCVNIAGDPCC